MTAEEGARIQRAQSKGCLAAVGLFVGCLLILKGLVNLVLLTLSVAETISGSWTISLDDVALALGLGFAFSLGIPLCVFCGPILKARKWELITDSIARQHGESQVSEQPQAPNR